VTGGKAVSSDARRRLGRWGENLAAAHLESNGYELLARNWRCARGEIDLVAQIGETIAFVEVKTRRGRAFGPPEEGVTRDKAKQLLKLGQDYIDQHGLQDAEWRIDLVAVELDNNGKFLRCEHILNVIFGW
jgi:putative endonuclease